MRWGRVLLAALLAEVALFAIATPFFFLPDHGAAALPYVIPPASLVVTALFGFWVARAAGNRFVLHGTLVGAVAALAYIALTWGKVLPVAYVVSHFLKVIGGAIGGFIAKRRPITHSR
jgi:putative membrane protein (TIGR04086 family)